MPNIPQNASPAALKLIIAEEALKFVAYLDSNNIVTIGAGHVILPKWDYALFDTDAVTLDNILKLCQKLKRMTGQALVTLKISREQAMDLLAHDVAQTVLFLRSVTRCDLNQNQFDALTSFVFNIGQGHYATSTTRKALETGDYLTAANAMQRWNKTTDAQGAKITSPGLTNRREAERALFLTPV